MDIKNAGSIALADGSVPVGKYTRQAMVNAGMLEKADDVSKISTTDISEALGGVVDVFEAEGLRVFGPN